MKKLLIILLFMMSYFVTPMTVHAADDIDFKELFDNHQSIMLIIHPITGEIYYANPAAAEFYGFSFETLMEMNINQINTLSPDEVAAERLRALNEERNFFIFKHRLADGDIKTVHVYSYPIEINGETYLYSIIIDQTEFILFQNRQDNLIMIIIILLILGIMTTTSGFLIINQKKKKLKESEQRFKALHNASFGGISIHNQGVILDCNQGLCEVTGYSKEELVGMNGLLLIIPEQRDYVIDKIKSGYELPYESVGVRKNGEIYPVRIEGRNIPYNGRKVRVTEFRDITESKKTENELIKSERRLDLAMSVKNEGIWDWDLETNTVEFDDRYYLMAGYTPKEFPYKLEEFLSRVHSDDVSMVMSNAEDYISEKRSDFQVEFRFLCRDKSWIWIEGKGKIFEHFKDGKPKRFVGTHTDISERKSAEMSLKKSEERFKIAQDMSPDGFTILHPVRNEKGEVIDFTFVYENQSIAQINQSEPEKVIGKSLLELYPDHRGTSIFESYVGVANTGVYRVIDEVYVGQVISKPVWLRLVVFSIQENIAILAQNISLFKKNEESILYASKHDFLTGLPNRRYFDEKIKEFDKPENYPLLISMIDIDGLKLINDTYGHQVGDQAIIQVANLLTECCTEPAFISRIGGDEFLIISPKTTVAEFKEKRNKLLTKISQIKIKEISLSLSFGATIKSDQSVGINDTITDAENSMYANKVLHSQSSRNQTINAICESLKEKYDEERIHSDRVSQFCALMGEKLQLSQNDQLELKLAGRMHDIGKITIPDRILKKPGKLTEDEWVILKSHTSNGYQILRSADQYSRLADYALTHHERFDGKGYPKGLKGDDIPLFSRIIGICDAYEAMTADRPYRKALTKEVAIAELVRCSGTQFDPRLVHVFINEVIVNE